ncbi:zonular occludens toxin, partial [Stutzerimonas stutzeri]
LALCVILGAGILVYRAYERYAAEKAQAATATSAPAGSMVEQVRDTVGSFIKPAGEAKSDAPESVASYIGRRVPRIPQLPSSAPIYDELTRPVSFPRLYCMSSTDPATYAREFGRMAHAVVNGTPTVCQCYTQQSTRVETDFAFCMRVVENGFFDPTLPDRSTSAQTQHAQNAPPPTMPPAHAAAVQPAGGPNLTVVPYQKGQFLW